MSRTTHDINLDHHGSLESDRLTVGSAFGRYYATDTFAAVLSDLDERLRAVEDGYAIHAGAITAGAFVQPYFRSDAIIATAFTSSTTADAVIE